MSTRVLTLRGADFDWRHNVWTNPAIRASDTAESLAAGNHPVGSDLVNFPFLKGIQFSLQPGQLLGICGEVRSITP